MVLRAVRRPSWRRIGGTTLTPGAPSGDPTGGIVQFAGLTLDQVGTPFRLQATGPSTAESPGFAVVAPVDVTLSISAGPHEVDRPVTITVTTTGGAPGYDLVLDFDDGTPVYVETGNATGSADVEHTFAAVGSYDVSVDVVDAISGTCP